MPTAALRRVARVSETPTNAWGYALVTVDEGGAVLDAWFPAPALGTADGSERRPRWRPWPDRTTYAG